MAAGTGNRYKPNDDFEEDRRDPILDIELSDSTELWLMQWPLNQLKPSDLNGVELSLKLQREGRLGSFGTRSGKSYDVMSFAHQKQDATVFMPTSLGAKFVGKISRQVSIIRYPEPDEYEKPGFNLNSQKSGGSWGKCLSNGSVLKQGSSKGTDGISGATLTYSMGVESADLSKHSKNKRRVDRATSSSGISSLGLDPSSEERLSSKKKRR